MNKPGYFLDQDDQAHWYFFTPCGPLPASVTCTSGSGTNNPIAMQYYGSDPNPQPPITDSCGYLGSFDTQVCQGFGANQLQCNYQGGTSGRKVSFIFNDAPTVGMPMPSETNYPQYQVVFSGPIKTTDPEPPARIDSPVIVIMSHPYTPNTSLRASDAQYVAQNVGESSGKQYMAASYVKWLELAGARVMPLSYSATDDEVDAAFAQVNGALFMGGGAKLPPAARRLWTNAVAANARGDTFPVWGTCLGFEWMMQLASGDDGILTSGFDSENLTLPLNLTAGAPTSRMLKPAAAMPVPFDGRSIYDALALPVTMNNHKNAVTPASFQASPALRQAFNILSTNYDRAGKEFISMVEHTSAPIWATQWHPEKNIFEQGASLPSGAPYEVTKHTLAAVSVSQYFANFFVQQCRSSTHYFFSPTVEFHYALIYNYTTSMDMYPQFVQTYFFDYSGRVLAGGEQRAEEPQ